MLHCQDGEYKNCLRLLAEAVKFRVTDQESVPQDNFFEVCSGNPLCNLFQHLQAKVTNLSSCSSGLFPDSIRPYCVKEFMPLKRDVIYAAHINAIYQPSERSY